MNKEIKDIPTRDLVNELAHREGVNEMILDFAEEIEIKTDGAARILIVID